MQIIARKHLVEFWEEHPEAKASLVRWEQVVKAGAWTTTTEISATFTNAKVLNDERVRFEVHHNDYRLIVAFDFARQIAFIKFLGSHAAYDHIDPFNVSLF